MSILARIWAWFLGRAASGGAPAAASEGPTLTADVELFVYVLIPEDIGPVDRGAKYEDPIDARLKELGLGEVSGGGSQLGGKRPDGTQGIEFCGVDLDVTNRDRALALLRDVLPQLGAPDATELHYTRGGTRLRDVYQGGKWRLGQAREMLHPGFGI